MFKTRKAQIQTRTWHASVTNENGC